ncbi:MAG: DUF4255 domain-containing protein [Leeuwenhoekiella sp.]
MIYETIEILREQVANYLDENGLGENNVAVGNVAQFKDDPEDANQELDDKVIITLLNMEEETALKNKRFPTIENDRFINQNNPVHLNLYLLLCCNRNDYASSLRTLSAIIEFFQGKQVFTQTNTVFSKNTTIMQAIDNFKFSVSLKTTSFEELNHIWGSLGGRSYPSAVYKLSLLQLQRKHTLGITERITIVDTTLANKNQ